MHKDAPQTRLPDSAVDTCTRTGCLIVPYEEEEDTCRRTGCLIVPYEEEEDTCRRTLHRLGCLIVPARRSYTIGALLSDSAI